MTKQQLGEAVAKDTGTPKTAVETTLDSTLKRFGGALQANDSVELRGFGSFIVKDKKARQGRNSRSGETIEIAAKREVSFRAASHLKEKLLDPEAAAKYPESGLLHGFSKGHFPAGSFRRSRYPR